MAGCSGCWFVMMTSCLNLGCLQDEVLRRAVAYYGAKNWKRIGTPTQGTPSDSHVWAGRLAGGPCAIAERCQQLIAQCTQCMCLSNCCLASAHGWGKLCGEIE